MTRLDELDIGAAFTLFMDGGCYHMIPPNRRDAYAESVRASPRRCPIDHGRVQRSDGAGMDGDELQSRLRGWKLLHVDRVPGEQMGEYVSGPAICARS